MKKKFSIVISLAFLMFVVNSCEQEDQISYINSVEQSNSIDKNSALIPQSDPLTKDETEEQNCGDPKSFKIYAGQDIEVGLLWISNNDEELTITYDLADPDSDSDTDWWLTEIHLFVGDIDDAPFTNSGNPQIGQFPIHGPEEMTQSFSHSVLLEGLSESVSIIAHAVVGQMQDGQIISTETAFGEGETEFSGNRWGWIIDYEIQNCDEDEKENFANEENEDSEDGEDSEDDEDGEDQDTETNQVINNEQEETNEIVLDQDDEKGCMDAYAYSSPENSVCLSQDFDQWGWTNKVAANDQHYVPGGITYTYPLYASAFDCAIDNSIEVGEVKVTVSGGDNVLYGSISVNLTKQELSITEINIYAGETVYPQNEAGNSTIALEEFDISLNNLNEKSYSVNWLPWYNQTNFIVHVKVCPEEILP